MLEQRVSLTISANVRGFESEVRRANRAQNELNEEFRESRRDASGFNREAERLAGEMRASPRSRGLFRRDVLFDAYARFRVVNWRDGLRRADGSAHVRTVF